MARLWAASRDPVSHPPKKRSTWLGRSQNVAFLCVVCTKDVREDFSNLAFLPAVWPVHGSLLGEQLLRVSATPISEWCQ